MLFDTWGGVLAHPAYQEFSLAYAKQVFAGVTRAVDGVSIPRIFFTKGGGQWLESMADCGTDALGLDWTVNLAQAKQRVAGKVALQGNLDPNTLFGSDSTIEAEVGRVLAEFKQDGNANGHVFNLGHGISQFTNPDRVECLVNAVKNQSKRAI